MHSSPLPAPLSLLDRPTQVAHSHQQHLTSSPYLVHPFQSCGSFMHPAPPFTSPHPARIVGQPRCAAPSAPCAFDAPPPTVTASPFHACFSVSANDHSFLERTLPPSAADAARPAGALTQPAGPSRRAFLHASPRPDATLCSAASPQTMRDSSLSPTSTYSPAVLPRSCCMGLPLVCLLPCCNTTVAGGGAGVRREVRSATSEGSWRCCLLPLLCRRRCRHGALLASPRAACACFFNLCVPGSRPALVQLAKAPRGGRLTNRAAWRPCRRLVTLPRACLREGRRACRLPWACLPTPGARAPPNRRMPGPEWRKQQWLLAARLPAGPAARVPASPPPHLCHRRCSASPRPHSRCSQPAALTLRTACSPIKQVRPGKLELSADGQALEVHYQVRGQPSLLRCRRCPLGCTRSPWRCPELE